MKFQVTQQNLNNCLKNVTPFADKGHQLDIIKNILIKTNKNLLEVFATNLEVSIIERIQGSCKTEGEITIPANLFKDYIQNLPSESSTKAKKQTVIELTLDKNKLNINCETIKCLINGLSTENYPTFPVTKKTKPFLEIQATELKKVLSQVIFASDKDLSRPILTTVLLHSFEGSFYLVATDSYRLAEKRIDKNLNKTPKKIQDINILIPTTTLFSLERVLSNNPDKKVAIYKEKDDKHITFVLGEGELEIISSVVEGTYPDYRKLLPQSFDTTIVVNKQALINVSKRISLFPQEGLPLIILNWEAKGKKLNIKSSASQIGENKEEITAKIKTKAGHDTTIILNVRYLQEVLQVIEVPEVELSLNSKLDPCIIRGLHKDKLDDNYRHAIMPRRS